MAFLPRRLSGPDSRLTKKAKRCCISCSDNCPGRTPSGGELQHLLWLSCPDSRPARTTILSGFPARAKQPSEQESYTKQMLDFLLRRLSGPDTFWAGKPASSLESQGLETVRAGKPSQHAPIRLKTCSLTMRFTRKTHLLRIVLALVHKCVPNS